MTAEKFYNSLGPSTIENGVIDKMKWENNYREYMNLPDLSRFAEAYCKSQIELIEKDSKEKMTVTER